MILMGEGGFGGCVVFFFLSYPDVVSEDHFYQKVHSNSKKYVEKEEPSYTGF